MLQRINNKWIITEIRPIFDTDYKTQEVFYTDVKSGVNYLRFNLVDNDGTEKLTKVVTVSLDTVEVKVVTWKEFYNTSIIFTKNE